MKGLLTAALAAALLCAAACTKHVPGTRPGVGDPLPEFALTLSDGTVLTAAHLKETRVMLTFFHTECPDCRRELPVVDEFKRRHPEREVYAVSRGEGRESVAAYWLANGLSLPYSPQDDRRIYDMFADSGIPYTVVSRSGTITAVFTDKDMPTVEDLEKAMP